MLFPQHWPSNSDGILGKVFVVMAVALLPTAVQFCCPTYISFFLSESE